MNQFSRLRTQVQKHFRTRMGNFQFVSANLFIMFSTFVLMPTVLKNYGVEYLGLFSLVLNITTIIPMLDFGYANSISTFVSRNKNYKILFGDRSQIRLNFLSLPIICIIVITALGLENLELIHTFLDGILSISEIRIIMLAMASHASMLIIFNVAHKIRIAMNLYNLSSKILFLNSLLVLFCSSLSILLQKSFLVFILTYLFSSWPINLFYLSKMLQSIRGENTEHPISAVNDGYLPEKFMSLNFTFFVVQLSSIISFQLDNFVVAKYLSLQDVALYSSATKFISVPISIFASYSLPIWTETSRGSFGKNQIMIFGNLSKILKKRVLTMVPIAMICFISLPQIIKYWSSDNLHLSIQMTFTLVCWLFISVITQPIAMATNGMFFQKFVLASGSIGAFINIAVTVYLCKNYDLISGPVIGSIVAQIASSIIPFLYIQWKNRNYET